MLQLADIEIKGKRVLIREDFNVPLDDNGQVSNDNRIQAALPTIRYALSQNAAVILMSHLGRPKPNQVEAKYSLAPVQQRLAELLQQEVKFSSDWLNGVTVQAGEVVLCENVRFFPGEKSNDDTLAKAMAALCDVFVMDAFATAHRAEASTAGVAAFAPIAVAGPLLQQEVNTIQQVLQQPQKPVMAIIGGAKVSSKLSLINKMVEKMDCLILGGGIANTFLAARGFDVGRSLYEADLVEEASSYLAKALMTHCEILLPQDVVVATELTETALTTVRRLDEIQSGEMILDIGPATIEHYCNRVQEMRTILWNGPVGVFEKTPFSIGTAALGRAIADSPAYTVAGGGDTVSAIEQFSLSAQIDTISTGGGAFLQLAEGKALPALTALESRRD